MNESGESRFGRGCWWMIISAWIVIVIAGIALVWFAFFRPSGDGGSEDSSSSEQAALARTLTAPTATRSSATATAVPVAASATPLSTATAEPVTAEPATATPQAAATATATALPEPTAAASVTVGGQGVNVRGGPGTNYSVVGFLNPGDQAPVTGRYSDWWQIVHNDAPGWVFGGIVTAENVDDVPEVQPPPAPTSPPATAAPAPTSPPPPTEPPPPVADTRGLEADGYQVEGAPGPYPVGSEIWFNMWISNKSGTTVEYVSLGTLIQENGQFQKSYSYSSIQAGQQFNHRDHLYANQLPTPGTYHLYLTICFHDGVCSNLAGPVEIVVQ